MNKCQQTLVIRVIGQLPFITHSLAPSCRNVSLHRSRSIFLVAAFAPLPLVQCLAQLSHPCCRSVSRSASRSRSPARSGSRSPPRNVSAPRSVSPQRYASTVHPVDACGFVEYAYSMPAMVSGTFCPSGKH